MLMIRFNNGVEYEAIGAGSNPTRVEPSDNPNIRSKMYIYMDENTMSLEDFIGLFSNEANLGNITFIGDTYVTNFQNYSVVQSVGKSKLVNVDVATGAAEEVMVLSAVLEQLTYTEQKLKELGL